jgi:hypothetical protein
MYLIDVSQIQGVFANFQISKSYMMNSKFQEGIWHFTLHMKHCVSIYFYQNKNT